jgi:hypothetical protein
VHTTSFNIISDNDWLNNNQNNRLWLQEIGLNWTKLSWQEIGLNLIVVFINEIIVDLIMAGSNNSSKELTYYQLSVCLLYPEAGVDNLHGCYPLKPQTPQTAFGPTGFAFLT